MEFQDKCPNCGHPRREGESFCSNCGKPFEESKPEGPPPERPPEQPSMAPPPSPEREYVAWEDRENTGFFGGLWQTWKESVFYPNRFFSALPLKGGIGSPLLYALIVGWLGIAVSQIYGLLWSGAWMGMMSHYMSEAEFLFGAGIHAFQTLAILIATLVIFTIGLFISSGILHLLFMIFGWANRDFEATFRAIAYSQGAMIWCIIPFCGSMIGWIWGIVLAIIGLKHMQKTTAGRAAVVYFLPIIVCCCLGIILATIIAVTLTGFMQEVMESGRYY